MPAQPVLEVAVPVPLRQTFDYLPAPGCAGSLPMPGVRVRVPFGRRRLVGVVTGTRSIEVGTRRLRHVEAVLDAGPRFSERDLELLAWAARYYHHPLGEVFAAALPAMLRKGDERGAGQVTRWRLTPGGLAIDRGELARAPRQAAVHAALVGRGEPGAGAEELATLEGDWRGALRALEGKGLVEPFRVDAGAADAAVDVIVACDGFATLLLDGVTGSGKTEVYLHAIEEVVARGRQALLLVPEIGLTPQLLERVAGHFGRRPAVLHSGLAEGARHAAWRAAGEGSADVVVGTRSAVFVPLARPGLVVVDEEHDASFKQQDTKPISNTGLEVLGSRTVRLLVGPGLVHPHACRPGPEVRRSQPWNWSTCGAGN